MATPEVTTRSSSAQGRPCRILTPEARKQHMLQRQVGDELVAVIKADPYTYEYDETTDTVRMRSDEEIALRRLRRKLEAEIVAVEAELSRALLAAGRVATGG